MKKQNPNEDSVMEVIIMLLSEILTTLKKNENTNALYYDSADVKKLLNISDSTLHRIRKERSIPHMKIGRKIFYPKTFFNNAFKL